MSGTPLICSSKSFQRMRRNCPSTRASVSAQYPGASPEIIAQTVATPIEEQINGVPDMIYMSSVSSSSGSMQISVTFAVGTRFP